MPKKPTYEELEQRVIELEYAKHERKLAVEALRESEEKYRVLFNQSSMAIYLHDLDGKILDANQVACMQSGYERDDLVKKNVFDFHPKGENTINFPKAEILRLWHQWKPGQRFNYKSMHQRKDGTKYPIDVSTGVIRYNGGTFILALCQDITEREKSAERQRKLEAQLNNAIEIAKLGYWEYDVEDARFTFNDQFFKIYHTTAKDVGGYSLSSKEYTERFIYPEDREIVGREIRKCLETSDPDFNQQIEHRITYADGAVGHINVRYFIVKDNQGKTVKTYGVNQDITNRKQLESKLQQAQKMESIGSLAGGIAHDFNNILFPILGIAEMLLEDLPPDSPEHESVQEIFKAGKRGRDLVRQILAFSRQSEHRMIPTRVQNILKEVLQLSRSTIPSYIEIDQKIQSDCGLIMADPTQIHQVAMNIITNAYHAMEAAGGTISIALGETLLLPEDLPKSYLEPGKYVVLSISDTGHGMSAELMKKIYDPYFTTKEKGKGTGLGLAVVYGIVREHKGDIHVYSEIGKGTTFRVFLPLMEKKTDTESIPPAEPLPGGDERILLVDDEESIVNLEKQMLERNGYHVTTRVNSLEALKAFRTRPDLYDLIISDMTMPNMTGDRLAGEIQKIRPGIPIIICTGFSERIDKERAKAIGVKGFLLKPVIRSEMAKMVRNVLDRTKKESLQ